MKKEFVKIKLNTQVYFELVSTNEFGETVEVIELFADEVSAKSGGMHGSKYRIIRREGQVITTVDKYGNSKMFLLGSQIFKSSTDKDLIKKKALNKLSEEEKKVLGLVF